MAFYMAKIVLKLSKAQKGGIWNEKSFNKKTRCFILCGRILHFSNIVGTYRCDF